jgi:PEP-CTERM motif
MKTKLLVMMLAAGVLGLSGAASAEIVTVTYTGTVTTVSNANRGVPTASDGDTLVATYVFNLADATSTDIDPTFGGTADGPYGSFVTALLTVNGVAGILPGFTNGELTGATQVSQIGTVLFADATDSAGNLFESDVSSSNFSWSLAPPLTGVSYDPVGGDEAIIQLQTAAGDLLGADVSNVTVTVSASAPAPEPSTWAMMLIGLAGVGVFSYRRRVDPSHAVLWASEARGASGCA